MNVQFAERSSDSPAICILALSAIADDPRVRRQAETFYRAGWRVTAVGLPGAKATAPEWPILTCDDPAYAAPAPSPDVSVDTDASAPTNIIREPVAPKTRSKVRKRLADEFTRSTKLLLRKESSRLAFEARVKGAVGRALTSGLRLLQAATDVRRSLLQATTAVLKRCSSRHAEENYWTWSPGLIEIFNRARTVTADIWLANDWNMLPIAARLARKNSGIYCYDTHEFAIEEYAENQSWRVSQRPMIGAVERKYIGNAAVISTVSSGIGERLERLYRLNRPTLTIRNTPAYEKVAFHPTKPHRIKVLYHGIVVPNRGLEAAIDSVPIWRPEFTLTIRGPENPAFSPALRERIAALELQNRVCLAPAVPMTALVREAAAFDVGFFALPGHSQHNQFALPNKIFEYVMAGLAAARELCWERESELLITAYDDALARMRSRVG